MARKTVEIKIRTSPARAGLLKGLKEALGLPWDLFLEEGAKCLINDLIQKLETVKRQLEYYIYNAKEKPAPLEELRAANDRVTTAMARLMKLERPCRELMDAAEPLVKYNLPGAQIILSVAARLGC